MIYYFPVWASFRADNRFWERARALRNLLLTLKVFLLAD